MLDEDGSLVRTEVAADRLGGVREPRVVAIHQGPGDQGSHRSLDVPGGQRCLECAGQDEAEGRLGLGAAPVQRYGRHDVGGQLVLDQQVAHLRTVPVGEQHVHPGGHQACHAVHRHLGGSDLVLRTGAAVRRRHGVAAERDQDAQASSSSHQPRQACGGCPGMPRP